MKGISNSAVVRTGAAIIAVLVVLLATTLVMPRTAAAGAEVSEGSAESAVQEDSSASADAEAQDASIGTGDSGSAVPMAAGKELEASKTVATDGIISVAEDSTSALMTGSSFGVSSFSRLNKGTNQAVDDVYYGYRYKLVSNTAFGVVAREDAIIVYIPQETLDQLGLSLDDKDFQGRFLATLEALDKASSKGGTLLTSLSDANVYFTSDKEVVLGNYTYDFGVQIGGDYWYITVRLADSADGSGGALFAETGELTAAEDTVVVEAAEGFAAVQRFFERLDWSPLWVSLRTTGAAIVVIFVLGLLAAWLTLRVSSKVKGVLDTVFTIPMVLPPTVCGFLLLLFFGGSTPTGQFFISMGIDLVFTWPAAVIACIVVGFPMMYRTVRGAFENIDVNMLDAARTLGWGEGRIFLRIMMPLAWPSIAAGTVLAFARAMGEFGCTLFFAGNYAGITQTIPLAIYFDWIGGKTDAAIFWVIVVILVSFLVILFINIYSSRTQRYRKRLGE